MGKAVVFKDVSFGYEQNDLLFDNFNLEIEDGSFTTIIGPDGSGKSTLAKIIVGIINVPGFIKIKNKFINAKNINSIRKQVGIVFDNPNNQFICDSVREDIEFALENFEYKDNIVEKKTKAIVDLFEINDILDCSPDKLSGGQKQLVALAIALAHDPKLIVLDDAFHMLDCSLKERVIKILKKINDRGVTIVNITNDPEDMLIGSDVVVINNGKVILNDKVKNVFDNSKLLIDNHVCLPFAVDLSSKLRYYGAVDKIYFDYKRMADDLWK